MGKNLNETVQETEVTETETVEENETDETTDVSKANSLDDVEDAETLRKMVRDLRKEAAKNRNEKNAKTAELEEFRKWKDSQKTELERANDRINELSAKAQRLAKIEAADAAGLDLELVDFIHGDTEEEMLENAKLLVEKTKKTSGKVPMSTNVFAGKRGAPIDKKKTGGDFLRGL